MGSGRGLEVAGAVRLRPLGRQGAEAACLCPNAEAEREQLRPRGFECGGQIAVEGIGGCEFVSSTSDQVSGVGHLVGGHCDRRQAE